MPCFNCEEYLEEAIESILAQTYRNLEIICCDDGSQDTTFQILVKYSMLDERIRVLKNVENRGLIYSLNLMIEESTGDFIARMDSDDISADDRIESLVKYLDDNGLDCVGSYYTCFGASNKVVLLPSEHEDIAFSLMFSNVMCHPSMLTRSCCLKSHKYSPDFSHVEDYELWTRLVSSGFKFGNIPKSLLKYRVHSNQISKKKYNEQLPKLSIIKSQYASAQINSELGIALFSFWQGSANSSQLTEIKDFFYANKSYFISNYIYIRKAAILAFSRNKYSYSDVLGWGCIFKPVDIFLITLFKFFRFSK